MAILYLPNQLLKKVAKKRAIKGLVNSNLSVNREALKSVSKMGVLSKKKTEEVALRVIKAYRKRAREELKEATFDSDKYHLSPDSAKQYGYKSKSTGLTALSEKMPDGPDTALVEYSENKFKSINSGLRSGDISNELKDYVSDIDKSFEVSVLKKPTTLYRGVSADAYDLSKLKEGSVIKDDAFMSTSPDISTAKSFSTSVEKGKGALFEIETGAGEKAVDLTSIKSGITTGESEILLPRNLKLEVVSVREENGLKIVKLKTKSYDDYIKKDAAIKKEITKNPKQLIQRVENATVNEISKEIEARYMGEKYEWLPSDAQEPDPEHQLLYGTIRTIGVGEMPGQRYGCKCGMNILTKEETLDL